MLRKQIAVIAVGSLGLTWLPTVFAEPGDAYLKSRARTCARIDPKHCNYGRLDSTGRVLEGSGSGLTNQDRGYSPLLNVIEVAPVGFATNKRLPPSGPPMRANSDVTRNLGVQSNCRNGGQVVNLVTVHDAQFGSGQIPTGIQVDHCNTSGGTSLNLNNKVNIRGSHLGSR